MENDKVKIRLPIQKGLFERILFECDRLFTETSQAYLYQLYRALFCLAYYGMMRIGELTKSPHTLKAGNIHVGHNKDKILVVLYTSKTHGKESKPQKIKISGVPVSNTKMGQRFFCPFKAVISFMNTRGHYQNEQEQFFIFRDGSEVRPQQVRNLLRQLLDRIGLDGALYDVHSFRSGRTCDLEKFGYSIEQIKSMGRWKSNAVYRYLKN